MKTKILFNLIGIFIALITFTKAQSISYSATGNANFLIIDPSGKKSGIDGKSHLEYDDIPSVRIGSAAYGPLDGESTPEMDNLVDAYIDPALEGTYTFIVFGDSLSKGHVSVITHYSDRGDVSNIFVESIVDSGLIFTAKLKFKDNDRTQTKLWKEINEDYLHRSLLAMRKMNWVKNDATRDNYISKVKRYFSYTAGNNFSQARLVLDTIQQELNTDKSLRLLDNNSVSMLLSDVAQLKADLPSPTSPNLNIALKNSSGTKISGSTLQYYDASWKDAVNNNDGTFSINTTKTSLSLRMTYAYGSQQKSNVAVNSDTVIFQTVNAQVLLKNSNGVLLDTGTVQYYAGAWRTFGTTSNGVATKELLANSYSFRMTYGYASNDTVQDLTTNPTVVFKTTNAQIQLKNSHGNLIDQGTVQYYAGAWRTFGTTANGIATKELLPTNYSFRMTYAYGSNDKAQNIKTNPTIDFQTVNTQIELKNSQGNLIDQGSVQYYSGAWRDFGVTTNGVVTKELLPNNYSFRMTNAFASNDKLQDLNTNPIVLFQTVNTSVQLKNSQGNLIDQGTVQYYSGAWRIFGSTSNGVTTKELLPNSYPFRMTHEYVSIDKTQNVGSDNTVTFSTVPATVQVKNSQNNPMNSAAVTYYAGAWRSFGTTVNGQTTKELLPVNLQFRAKLGTAQADKTQNLSTNPLVEIQLNVAQ